MPRHSRTHQAHHENNLEDRIAELERRLAERDEELTELRTRVGKARSTSTRRGEHYAEGTEERQPPLLAGWPALPTDDTGPGVFGAGGLSGTPESVVSLVHELKQPLTSIATYSQACLRLLQSENGDQDELIHALEQIAAQAEHAGRCIRHLRERLSLGKAMRKPVQTNAHIRSALRLCEGRFREEQVQVRVQLKGSLPLVMADPVQLEQVLLNLIHNAVDAMRQSPPDQRVLTVNSKTEEGEVVVALGDTGTGLNKETAQRLFQPIPSSKPQGMGVGLALCRGIIQAHQGRIWAICNPDRGTTFFFSLPYLTGT